MLNYALDSTLNASHIYWITKRLNLNFQSLVFWLYAWKRVISSIDGCSSIFESLFFCSTNFIYFVFSFMLHSNCETSLFIEQKQNMRTFFHEFHRVASNFWTCFTKLNRWQMCWQKERVECWEDFDVQAGDHIKWFGFHSKMSACMVDISIRENH